MSFPINLHGAAVSDTHLQCHALTVPFFSRPWHSTAVKRRPVGCLPAFSFFRVPHGVPRRLSSEAYQSSQRSIPMIVKSGSSTLQKRQSVKLLDWQFGYFRLPRKLSQRTRHCRSRAGAQHGICELTARPGRGMAWSWHAMCELAFTVVQREGKSPLICVDACKINQITLPDRMKVAPMQDMLQRFHGTRNITMLDLKQCLPASST